jgi:hypothetical protein
MRRGDPGRQDDADANRALHILDRPPSLMERLPAELHVLETPL